MIGGIQSENLTSGWSWVDEITVPTVTNNGYAAVKTVDVYENFRSVLFAFFIGIIKSANRKLLEG